MDGMGGAGEGQSPWNALNQAAAGNPGAGEAYRALREWGEFYKPRRRGMPYGTTDTVTDGLAIERMQRFCPDWDGDMRWPPPGFLEQEAEMTRRADAFESMDTAAAGYRGPVPHSSGKFSLASPLEAHQRRIYNATQQAFSRHDAWLAEMDARDAADRQRRDADRQRRDADQQRCDAQRAAREEGARNHQHELTMQRERHEHERQMQQMELYARTRGWRQ